MNDGGEESKRREGQYNNRSSNRAGPSSSSSYGGAISKVAVAQACESVGFESVKVSALEALSDIAVRYIRDLGKSSVYYANLSGRSEPNVFDIIEGLEDLAITRGFLGASGIDYCATSSGALKELIDFVGTVEEIPFAQPVLQFPVSKSCTRWNSYIQTDAEPSEDHIPAWLPLFPESQTCLKSPPMQNERRTDSPVGIIADQERQQEKPEKPDARLQQRLLSGAAAGPSGLANPSEQPEHVNVNPFLAPPLPAGAREVSRVRIPSKLLHYKGGKSFVDPLSETLALGSNNNDAAQGIEEETRRMVDSEKRPVRFRLKTSRKMLGVDLDAFLQINEDGEGLVTTTVEINEERDEINEERDEINGGRDEKKRKAALILRQSMEHPQELT